jgi:GT2 family glycosyltransferase
MKVSIVIVSRNRRLELEKTLRILEQMLDFSQHEVLVFLDGCTDDSMKLLEEFNWVKWSFVGKNIGASVARNKLYPNAKGAFLIGFDDDAHPLNIDFISQTLSVFEQYPKVGIIAFEEIKGVFKSNEDALKSSNSIKEVEYLTNDFIGSGFAIRKKAYDAINGFPVWMDIYGEESCVALEVIGKGYEILYTNKIKVNHRVDKEARKKSGKNYFRFERQLKNTTSYYLVYYKNPVFKIMKLYWHNFRKYALSDVRCFGLFFKVIVEVVVDLPTILKYRNPIMGKVINRMRELKPLQY